MKERKIKFILTYKDLFDDQPQHIDHYLSCLTTQEIQEFALHFLSLSTISESFKQDNILWAFFNKTDQKIISDLSIKITNFIQNHACTILNLETSLKLCNFAFDESNSISPKISNISETDKRIAVFKAYLLLNGKGELRENYEQEEELSLMFFKNDLKFERFKVYELDFVCLWISQLIKARMFFEFAEKNLKTHLSKFLQYYNVDTWKEYIQYLHQITNLVVKGTLSEPYYDISIPLEDPNYSKKKEFIENFCIQKSGWSDDKDFTIIKNNPIHKNADESYRVIFTLFLVEKIHQGLYWKFKEINNSIKDVHNDYQKNIRSFITTEYSEKHVVNNALKGSFPKKRQIIKLDSEQLNQDGDIDFYVRNRKHIFLFEGKDILVNANELDSGSINFLKDKLVSGKDGLRAVEQLANNVERVIDSKFTYDLSIPQNFVIYPIIVVHNSIFSLRGVNNYINKCFKEKIEEKNISDNNIENLTIIDIDTLILYQNLFKQMGTSLRRMVIEYWKDVKSYSTKRGSEEEVIENLMHANRSFKSFCNERFRDKIDEVITYNKEYII